MNGKADRTRFRNFVGLMHTNSTMYVIDNIYRLFCSERFPLPTEDMVAAAERRLGTDLPARYRDFLLNYNGGYFEDPTITPPGDEEPLDLLAILYGIGTSSDSTDVASERNLTLFDGNNPPQILPVGYTVGGNMILLVTRQDSVDEYGSLILKKAWKDEYHFLAADIQDFFALVGQPPIEST